MQACRVKSLLFVLLYLLSFVVLSEIEIANLHQVYYVNGGEMKVSFQLIAHVKTYSGYVSWAMRLNDLNVEEVSAKGRDVNVSIERTADEITFLFDPFLSNGESVRVFLTVDMPLSWKGGVGNVDLFPIFQASETDLSFVYNPNDFIVTPKRFSNFYVKDNEIIYKGEGIFRVVPNVESNHMLIEELWVKIRGSCSSLTIRDPYFCTSVSGLPLSWKAGKWNALGMKESYDSSGAEFLTITRLRSDEVLRHSIEVVLQPRLDTRMITLDWDEFTPPANLKRFGRNKCHIDELERLSETLRDESAGPYEYILRIIDWLQGEFRYDKRVSRERSDVKRCIESLRERRGVCEDYAILFNYMVRSQGIPALAVIGYAGDDMGEHAWNLVWLGRWTFVDPTWALVGGVGLKHIPTLLSPDFDHWFDEKTLTCSWWYRYSGDAVAELTHEIKVEW